MNCSEEWRRIDGFPEKIQVSNLGNVRSNNKILSCEKHKTGYIRIHTSHKGDDYREFVHRLVAKDFLPNPENKPCVNHIDGNKQNNCVSNLEWCTYGENLKHAYKIKLRSADGEKNTQHKLTERDVLEIRSLYERRNTKGNNANALAKKYNVSSKVILDIVKRKIWKSVL